MRFKECATCPLGLVCMDTRIPVTFEYCTQERECYVVTYPGGRADAYFIIEPPVSCPGVAVALQYKCYGMMRGVTDCAQCEVARALRKGGRTLV